MEEAVVLYAVVESPGDQAVQPHVWVYEETVFHEEFTGLLFEHVNVFVSDMQETQEFSV